MDNLGGDEKRNKTKKPKSKSPTIRILPSQNERDIEKVYTDHSIQLDRKKVKTFKNSYSIKEFELLAAEGKIQEAYWASYILRRLGVEVDESILEKVKLNVEFHWPDLYRDKMINGE